MKDQSHPIGENPGDVVNNALESIQPASSTAELPLRIPVQGVEHDGDRSVVAGRIATGRLQIGDTLLFSSGNLTARVEVIEDRAVGRQISEAGAGRLVHLALDQDVILENGEVASHTVDAPVETDVFKARLFWVGGDPLTVGLWPGRRVANDENMVERQANS